MEEFLKELEVLINKHHAAILVNAETKDIVVSIDSWASTEEATFDGDIDYFSLGTKAYNISRKN